MTVKEAREKRGYSQVRMAKKLDMCRETYLRKEKDVGEFTIAQLARFCEVCGIAFEELSLPIGLTKIKQA